MFSKAVLLLMRQNEYLWRKGLMSHSEIQIRLYTARSWKLIINLYCCRLQVHFLGPFKILKSNIYVLVKESRHLNISLIPLCTTADTFCRQYETKNACIFWGFLFVLIHNLTHSFRITPESGKEVF